jgi:D-xylose transport system permease protein
VSQGKVVNDQPKSAVAQVDPRLLLRQEGVRGYWDEFIRRITSGDLGSIPVVVALIIIWAIFTGMNGRFLSAQNLSTLSVQIVPIGMMSIGIVFVLLLGEIDLSVGSVSGLASAVLAVVSVREGINEILAVVLAVLAGTAIGFIHGFFFAKIGVPAFIVTLAGLLGWNGLQLWILGPTGSLNFRDNGIALKLTSYFFPQVAAAYGLAAVVVVLYLVMALLDASRRKRNGVPGRPLGEIILRTVLLAILAFAVAIVLNQYQGLPLALVVFLVFVVGLGFILRRTSYGRKIFALGGSVEAARRAGINVSWIRISVFMIAGTMSAIGGIYAGSLINSASLTSGGGNTLMNAIAAAVIGGTSLFGGRGSTYSALIGALVIQSIASGMALESISGSIQFMVTGVVLLAAVTIDSVSRRTQKASGRA